jgi:hypothetical protein
VWDLWCTKWYWGKYFPSTVATPAYSHFTNFVTLIISSSIIQGWYNRPTSDQSTKWPQSHLKNNNDNNNNNKLLLFIIIY